MANRFPLVLDTDAGNKIKELPSGDNLNLRESSIVNVQDITALGTINAADIRVNGNPLVAQSFAELTDTPNSFAGAADYFVKVKEDGTGLEFRPFSDIGNIEVETITVSEDILPATSNQGSVGTDIQKFQRVTANELKGSLLSFDGSTIFNANTGFISYAALQGAPQFLSEFTDDIGFLRTSDLDTTLSGLFDEGVPFATDIKGSVFADDSTVLVDGTSGKILGEVDTFVVNTSVLTSQEGLGNINIIGGPNAFGGSVNITGGTGIFERGGTISINGGSGVTADGFVNIGQSSDEVRIDGNDLFIGTVVGNINLGRAGSTTTVFGTFDFTNATAIGTLDGELTGSVYYDDSTQIIDAVAGRIISPIISGTANFEDNVIIDQNLTVLGNLIVQGTTTSLETTNTTITDNIIVLNEGEIGAGVTAGTSGIEIDRGLSANVTFLWNEATDKWTVGSQTIVAATFEGNLTGNVTGNVSGNVTGNTNGTHTGPVVGPVTGNLTGDVVGDVIGSIFGDDSTLLVDANDNLIRGNLASTNWTTDSYTKIDVNGFLEIEPEIFQLNAKANGYLQFNAGAGSEFTGGYVQITAGDGGTSAFGIGGYVRINAGDGSAGTFGNGGYVRIDAGDASATATSPAGYVQINAGDANGGNISGGYVQITAGNSTGNSTGSYLQLTGGAAVDGTGGEVRIGGGASENGAGGDVVIEGGIGGSGTDGKVRIFNAEITGSIDNDTTLNIGATSATAINIGRSGSTTTVLGTVQFTNALIANNLTADDSISITTAIGDGNAISIGPQGTNTFVNLTADNIRFFGPITENINAEAGVTGDLKGSVFGDDSTVIVDSVNNVLNAAKVTTDRVESNTDVTVESANVYVRSTTGTVQLRSNGSTVQIAGNNGFGTITYDDSDGDILIATTGTTSIIGGAGAPINIGGSTSGTVSLGNGSNTVDFVAGTTVDFNGAVVTGFELTGDVKGSVFADDSSVMVDAVNFTMFSDILTLTPLNAEPINPMAGMLVTADGTSWDPGSKAGAVPYPVFYDGVSWNALY